MSLSLLARVRCLNGFLLLVIASLASAQQLQDYQNGRSYFPNPLAPYSPRHVTPPNLGNSPRVDTLMRNGQIMLSLDDAIALGLENNLDIAIARYNLPISDTDILRAKSGQQILGVNTGLVQGTPGGGVGSTTAGGLGTSTTGAAGSGTGGTSAAAGGAGTGSAGLVLSTEGSGPPIGSFDPTFTVGLNLEHLTQPTASPFQGALALGENTGTANFSYSQYFASGTTLNVGFNNQRQTTNSTFTELSPILNGGIRLTVTQHLLQGLSFNANRRLIKIAKNNREISDVAFRNQVIQTVSQIENIYWDLASAYENVRVQESSLALAQKTLADNKKQVEIGTLAPIEIVRAESAVASANQSLIVAQTNLQLQELLMKNAITKNLSDPVLVTAHVVPTDTMTLPATEPVVPVQDLINDALSHRPELAQSRIDLTNREITRKATANLLLPSVDLVGWFGTNALAGDANPLAICTPGQGSGNRFCIPPSQVRPATGYHDVLSTLFGYNYPDYAIGFNVNIPILNRSAQATQVRSELEYRQSQMRLQQLQNQIAIEVRNAQFTVQQNRAQVLAAQSAEELARQSLDAEQKKYALGASTTTLVLTAQRDLAQAQANSVAALDNYEKSKVQLDLATGLTLTHNGIVMAEAESGKVQTVPHVPGVTLRQPSQELQFEQKPQSGVPQPPPATTQPQTTLELQAQPQPQAQPQAVPEPQAQPQTVPEPQAQPQTAAPATVAPSGGQVPQPATPQPQQTPTPQPQPQS